MQAVRESGADMESSHPRMGASVKEMGTSYTPALHQLYTSYGYAVPNLRGLVAGAARGAGGAGVWAGAAAAGAGGAARGTRDGTQQAGAGCAGAA